MTIIAKPTTFRWTRDDYDRAVELGALDGRRVQLIEGEIIEMAPQREDHAYAITLADRALRKAFSEKNTTIRIQLPMRLPDDSEPEPDLAVLAGALEQHRRHPTTALLVLEIADSSLSMDRRKARLYASAGVGEYWIVNLNDRCVEVHRQPVRTTEGGWSYDDVRKLVEGETISPSACPGSQIAVADLLP